MDPNLPIQSNNTQQLQQPDPHYVNQGGSPLKKILIVGIVIFIILVIIGGGIYAFLQAQGSRQNEDVTLTYWGLWDEATVMQPIIADFERTHPNIKIQYEMQDIKGLGQYMDRLTTRINNGSGPDIIRFHSSWTLQLSKYLVPFPKAFIDDTQLESDFYNTVERDMKINGAYYGIPLGVDTLAMFVNTNLLQDKGLSVPQYWNEIYEKYAPELVVKDQSGKILTPSIALGTYDNIAHAPDIVAALMLQNGADLLDMAQSEESVVGALKYYTSFSKGNDAVWDETLDNSTLAFAKGNLAIYFGYSWDVFSMRSLNPTLEYQVVNVPSLSDRNTTVASYWAEGISIKTQHSEEALEFLKYLAQPDTLTTIHAIQAKVRPFGTLYPRRSMSPLLSSNDLVYPFISQADNAQSTFFSSDTYDGDTGMITQMDVYLGNAIRSINNNTSAESASKTLINGVNQVLSRY